MILRRLQGVAAPTFTTPLTILVTLAILGVLAAAAPAARAAARPARRAARAATPATPYARKFPPLLTRWTRSVSSVAPLPEYPRPQLQRSRWQSLNGRWQYEAATATNAGAAPPFGRTLAETILVPFPVQSPLSGIERGDTHGWYRRAFTVPAAWRAQHVLLNFGAVSWHAQVYVNRHLVGTHRGDYDGFSFDITRFLHRGATNELIVGYDDPIGGAGEPVGKQVAGAPSGIYHSASSGIWQTVWLEPVSAAHLTGLELTPDLPHDRLLITAQVTGAHGAQVLAQARAGNRVVATAQGSPGRQFALPIAQPRPWSPAHPYLYGLTVQLLRPGDAAARTGNGRASQGRSGGAAVGPTRGTGSPLDRVESYFGMRSITLGRIDGTTRLLLNGSFVFQTGALDQGYWPDGLYTPPSDAALRFDISTAKRLGYNMLREHVKVESDRWYYWADKLGILVWQDMPNMPVAGRTRPTAAAKSEFRRELAAIVSARRAHPSIVMWVPFNEGWGQFDVGAIVAQVRRLDPAALIDADSGSANCCNARESHASDVRDSHVYFGPFAVPADGRASVIGEYGGVLPFASPPHRWPGVLTSVGSLALEWSIGVVTAVLRQQYAQLLEEMKIRGLSGAVFTELGSYEQELGMVSYDRAETTMPPGLVHQLNRSLIAASQRMQPKPRPVRRERPKLPWGTLALWRFDGRVGTVAVDSTGHGHTLTLQRGAAWTSGVHGGALSITAPGEEAASTAPMLDTSNSFTVSAWLNPAAPRESATAVSELGPFGATFSLGLQTAPQGLQSLSGLVADGRAPVPGMATRWNFLLPDLPVCSAANCGVGANLRYDDGRGQPQLHHWTQVTGVFDNALRTATIYVDGVPEDVEHVDIPTAASGPLIVGAGGGDYAPSDTFIGAIDQVRLYGRALSPAEVWQLHAVEQLHG